MPNLCVSDAVSAHCTKISLFRKTEKVREIKHGESMFILSNNK